ncbi:hypothetical protein DRJ54_03820 [Candidatus Acetothermia bacterium]|nr:MAG: hypothetical protein DRJ54_03820 [Candidatus Acetothermia bacterium]
MKDHDRSWYTVREAAEILGVSTSTVKRRIKQGVLEARREGNRYLINRSSLEQLTAQMSGHDRSVSAQTGQLDLALELERLREQNRMLQQRVRELEADKAYLQERIVALEKLIETLTPKALPKPPLRERVKTWLKRRH